MELKVTIGNKLRELRKAKGLNQIQVSQIIEVDRSSIAKYETGAVSPSVYTLTRFAKLFEVSVDYILGMSDN